jgi:hypothetical protein
LLKNPFLLVLLLGTAVTGYPQSASNSRKNNNKLNLSAPSPRLNGRPDLSGVWQARRTPLADYPPPVREVLTRLQVDHDDVTKNYLNIFWGMKPEEEPLRPEAAAIVEEFRKRGDDPPSARCLPASLPASLMILVFKMIQAPRETVVLFDDGDPSRQIFTDGRSVPNDISPSWMGYSVGRWQGDIFVVETSGFNDRAALDGAGHPRSEGLRMTERYRRRDFGHMDLDLTLDDSKYYTHPFSLHLDLTLQPDTDIYENVCNENEKDRSHVGGAASPPNR